MIKESKPQSEINDPDEKRRTIPRWVFFREGEMIVRPNIPEEFIEINYRFSGFSTKNIFSKKRWIRVSLLYLSVFPISSVLTLFLFAYIEAIEAGLVLVIFFLLLFILAFLFLTWPFRSSKERS